MAAIFLSWSPSLLTGIAEIDAQHRTLVDQVNGVYSLMIGGATTDRIAAELELLMQHTTAHFSFEEKRMRAAGYQQVEAHVREHHMLLGAARNKLLAWADGEISAMELAKFVARWVTQHIRECDMAYVPCLLAATG